MQDNSVGYLDKAFHKVNSELWNKMAETLLNLLTQECERHPDYERFVELFNGLDPSGPPRIAAYSP